MKTKNYFKKAVLLFLVCSAQIIMAQVPSYVPISGLVGYWPFDGNTNDASVNGNNGTNNEEVGISRDLIDCGHYTQKTICRC